MSLVNFSGNTGFDNNPTCAEPTGVAAGDELYAIVYQMYSTGAFIAPSGWTQIGPSQIQGDAAAALFHCTRGASAPGYVWTSADAPYWAIQVLASRGRDATPVFIKDYPHQFIGPTPAVLTFSTGTVPAGTDLLCLYGITINGAALTCSPLATALGTGDNLGGQAFGPSASDLGYLANIGPGATGTMTTTLDSSPTGSFSDGAIGWIIALQPSGGGGGGGSTPVGVNTTQTQTPSARRVISKTLSTTQYQLTSGAPLVEAGLIMMATETQTPSQRRALSRVRTITQTQAPARARALALTRTATETQTAARTRSIPRALSANQAQTPSRLTARAAVKTVTSTQTPTRTRALAKGLTANQVQTPSRIRALTKALSAIVTQAASRLLSRSMTRTVTSTQTPAIARSFARLRSVTQAQTASMLRALFLTRAAVANATPGQTNDHSTDHPVGVNATQTQTPSARRALVLLRNATHTQAPSVMRALSLQRSAVNSQAPTRLRSLAKAPLTVTQTQTPSTIKGQSFFRTLTATLTQAASLVRGRAVERATIHAQAPALSRAIAVVRLVVATQVGSRLRALARSFTANQVQAPSQQHGAGAHYDKTVAAQQTQFSSVTWQASAAFAPAAPEFCSPIIDLSPAQYESRVVDLRD